MPMQLTIPTTFRTHVAGQLSPKSRPDKATGMNARVLKRHMCNDNCAVLHDHETLAGLRNQSNWQGKSRRFQIKGALASRTMFATARAKPLGYHTATATEDRAGLLPSKVRTGWQHQSAATRLVKMEMPSAQHTTNCSIQAAEGTEPVLDAEVIGQATRSTHRC